MEPETHAAIDPSLCGRVVELQPGYCKAALVTREEMAADAHGLVHGGFIFGLADYAAMLAVNRPNVVLARADCRFLRPVRVGETVVAEAEIADEEGAKSTVTVRVLRDGEQVLVGELFCYTPADHVLGGSGAGVSR